MAVLKPEEEQEPGREEMKVPLDRRRVIVYADLPRLTPKIYDFS